MSHVADLLVLLGVILAVPAAFAAGWWARGRHRKPVA
jgi:hypothetical protein